MNATPHVLVEDLRHDYGRGTVLDVPRLSLGPGIHALTGPNGAGKSTLLAILATLVRPTAGRVELAGHDAAREGVAVRRVAGYAGHAPSLHGALAVRENLRFHARLHGLEAQRVDEALDGWALEAVADTPVQALSHGQARRADLARATLHDPAILLLDEPFVGLDDAARSLVRAAIEGDGERTVLVATHDPDALAARSVVALDAGRLAEGPA